MGPGTILPLVVTSGLVPIISSLREPPFLVYYRRGGVSGLIENLVIYTDGRGIYRRDGEEFRGEVTDETMSALEVVLNRVSERGFTEVSPKAGIEDYLHHEVIYSRRGERFAWVDEWASEVELPPEVLALTSLLDYAISQVRGERWVNRVEVSTAYLVMRASLDRIVARRGDSLSLRVSVAPKLGVEVSYTLPDPHHPDVEIGSDAGASVKFLRSEARTSGDARRLLPREGLDIEASMTLEGEEGLHWITVHFPARAPSVEASLPIVIVRSRRG